MYRLDLIFCVVVVAAIASTSAQVPIVKNCRTSVPTYNCGNDCMAFFVGCFHSKGANTILPQSSIVNLRSTIDWKKWQTDGNAGDLITKCAKLAVQKNKKYFGIEYYGECYFGNVLTPPKLKVTTVDGCQKYCGYDVGGPDAMVVYEIVTPPGP